MALTRQVVLLGAGGAGPDSRRAGSATAIVVDGRAYLVDFGPGVVRRAAAAHDAGIAALDPVNLTHAFAAWQDDGLGPPVHVHEIASGVVYRDSRITVTASAGGYRLQTADRTVVVRGDSIPSEAVVEQCNGCDVLIHEVRAQSVRQLGEIATRARPGFLILHSLHPDENELNRQMRNLYRGRFIVGHDLDVY